MSIDLKESLPFYIFLIFMFAFFAVKYKEYVDFKVYKEVFTKECSTYKGVVISTKDFKGKQLHCVKQDGYLSLKNGARKQ